MKARGSIKLPQLDRKSWQNQTWGGTTDIVSSVPLLNTYRISANSFRGNYSFLNLTLCTVTFGDSTYRCGNYSRKETIQGRKLFAEIRCIICIQIRKSVLLNPVVLEEWNHRIRSSPSKVSSTHDPTNFVFSDLFSQNLWKTAHPKHHEQCDCQTWTDGILQMPGRYVMYCGLYRMVPRNGQWDRKAH